MVPLKFAIGLITQQSVSYCAFNNQIWYRIVTYLALEITDYRTARCSDFFECTRANNRITIWRVICRKRASAGKDCTQLGSALGCRRHLGFKEFVERVS
jgi:hypothetical protein